MRKVDDEIEQNLKKEKKEEIQEKDDFLEDEKI